MPPALVIFDCDGVLIDSEPVSRALLAEEARALGWDITPEYCMRFTGLTWSAIRPVYEAATGRALPESWPDELQRRLVARLRTGVTAMPGAGDALRAVAALGLPYRVASNSSHEEMAEKFARTGLAPLVVGRVHSARDVSRGKPAPDLFLAAASAEGVAPTRCVVIEDSAPGLAAAHAAGMRTVCFAPDGPPPGLGAAPHETVRHLNELAPLLAGLRLGKAA